VWWCGSITYGVCTCALFGEVCRIMSGIPLQIETLIRNLWAPWRWYEWDRNMFMLISYCILKCISWCIKFSKLICILYRSTTSVWPTTSFHKRAICCLHCLPYVSQTERQGIQYWSPVQDQTICKLRQDVSVNSHLTVLPGFIVWQR
jgi:hypothetical protein